MQGHSIIRNASNVFAYVYIMQYQDTFFPCATYSLILYVGFTCLYVCTFVNFGTCTVEDRGQVLVSILTFLCLTQVLLLSVAYARLAGPLGILSSLPILLQECWDNTFMLLPGDRGRWTSESSRSANASEDLSKAKQLYTVHLALPRFWGPGACAHQAISQVLHNFYKHYYKQ